MTRLLLALVLIATASNAVADVRVVFVKRLQPKADQSDLFVIDIGGQARQLTHDGIPKGFPVWSRDGSKVAYFQEIDEDKALGKLMVVDRNGVVISDMLIDPVASHRPPEMRFIDTVQWLADSIIAVSGSMLPGMEATSVVDLAKRREITNVIDESRDGASFSPDGKHVAYEDGMPHFSPEAEWLPALNIDYRRVFPKSREHVTFLTGAKWSLDGRSVAVVYKKYETNDIKVAVWRRDGSLSIRPLDTVPEHEFHLFSRPEGYLIDDHKRSWNIRSDGSGLTTVSSSSTIDLANQEAAARKAMDVLVYQAGGTEADVWCDSCALASLPRRATSIIEVD